MPSPSKQGAKPVRSAARVFAAERSGAGRQIAPNAERAHTRDRARDRACAHTRARIMRARARGSSQSRITPPPNVPFTWRPGDPPEDWIGVAGRLHSGTTKRCEQGRLTALVWDRDTGDVRATRGYCRGYRCRQCGSLVAKELRDRVTTAVQSRGWWLYLVLTFNPAAFDSSWDAYRRAGVLWDKRLRQRIEHAFGPFCYIQTWERHVGPAQFPHLNLVLSGDGLRRATEEAGVEDRYHAPAGHGKGRWCRFPLSRPWWTENVPACGFGLRVWVEVLDREHSIAAYLAKAAEDLSAARWKAGDQTPIGAPPHFRRLRASRGLLPPLPPPDPYTEGLLVPRDLAHVPFVAHASTGEAIVDPAFVAQAIRERREALERQRTTKRAPRFETGRPGMDFREVGV